MARRDDRRLVESLTAIARRPPRTILQAALILSARTLATHRESAQAWSDDYASSMGALCVYNTFRRAALTL